MGDFLRNSLLLSLALTVILNVGVWLYGRTAASRSNRARNSEPMEPYIEAPLGPYIDAPSEPDIEAPREPLSNTADDGLQPKDAGPRVAGPRVEVFFPWKVMLVGSVLLTVLVNVMARL